MATKHLTRKEIKEDRIKSVLVDVYDWLTENTRWLVLGLVGIVALIAASYGWQNYRQGQNEEIQTQFAEALKIYHSPLAGDAAMVEPGHEGHEHPPIVAESEYKFDTTEQRNEKALEAFRTLTEDYSGTRLGIASRYYMGLAQQNLGKTAEAEESLKKVLADSDEPEIRNLARNYLAYMAQIQGKNEEAIEYWQAILDDESHHLPKDKILMSLAQTYESMGNGAEALNQYRRLTTEYPNSSDARDVGYRIEQLEAELDIKPEAKAPETPTGN